MDSREFKRGLSLAIIVAGALRALPLDEMVASIDADKANATADADRPLLVAMRDARDAVARALDSSLGSFEDGDASRVVIGQAVV